MLISGLESGTFFPVQPWDKPLRAVVSGTRWLEYWLPKSLRHDFDGNLYVVRWRFTVSEPRGRRHHCHNVTRRLPTSESFVLALGYFSRASEQADKSENVWCLSKISVKKQLHVYTVLWVDLSSMFRILVRVCVYIGKQDMYSWWP